MTSQALPTTAGTLLSHSWLDALIQQQPLQVSGTGHYKGQEVVLLGLDHGNDALKLATAHRREGHLVVQRTVTSYAPAQVVRSGEGVRSWQVDGSEPFWIGEDAITDGDSLSIGGTAERLSDTRHLRFLAASLTNTLIEAGYAPGAYALVLGVGLPNEEIQQGDATAALKELHGQTFQVFVEDPTQGRGTWDLTLTALLQLPQTLGTYIAWSRTPDGAKVANVAQTSIIDIGGGHLQTMHIAFQDGKMRVTGSIVGEGTIVLARQLQQKLREHPRFKTLRLSVAETQQALMSRQVPYAGQFHPIDDLVTDVITSMGQTVLARSLSIWQDTRRFVICTGGGAALLTPLLLERAEAVGRSADTYLIVPTQWASVANAVGLFASATAVAHGGT
jgi:hypothetical protein